MEMSSSESFVASVQDVALIFSVFAWCLSLILGGLVRVRGSKLVSVEGPHMTSHQGTRQSGKTRLRKQCVSRVETCPTGVQAGYLPMSSYWHSAALCFVVNFVYKV